MNMITKQAGLRGNTYTLSARGKKRSEPVFHFLRSNFGNLPLGIIESVFGFVERSTLYGGRIFEGRQLSDRDVYQLNNSGIGLRIPFTNHFAEREEYEATKPVLKKYHCELNSVIVTNDNLAQWIREDFPHYDIEASVIKNVNTMKKLEQALLYYDTIVLPMTSNNDMDFLEKITDKNRIRLFANGGCALTCPSRICYRSISELNKCKGGKFQCSQPLKKRDLKGMIDFDIRPLNELGYHRFKLLRARPGNMTGY